MSAELIAKARQIIEANDRGHYTIPTKGLYPFQWNWDSALTALGFSHFDEGRGWVELETLFAHQWEDGMVPHIIFHERDEGYFPGPEIWGTGRPVPTSGITQPPVAGFALCRLYERARDRELAKSHARTLLPKIHAWHEWFYRHRDPDGSGLVAIIHPWESGRDNSVDWDEALGRVPSEGVAPFTRRDTAHADPAHRPSDAEYQRYIWLVEHFRSLDWDNAKLHDASPFRMLDPGFNAILIRSCQDLAALADKLGEEEIAAKSHGFAKRGLVAMETLWHEGLGQYACYDRVAGSLIDSPSIGGLLAAFCAIPEKRADAIARRIRMIGERTKFIVPSHDPDAPEFDAKRYWRGPAWLIANYIIADGLARAGQDALAGDIFDRSIQLIEAGGFAEYYDPLDGTPCGGDSFTWTAAMVIEILSRHNHLNS